MKVFCTVLYYTVVYNLFFWFAALRFVVAKGTLKRGLGFMGLRELSWVFRCGSKTFFILG